MAMQWQPKIAKERKISQSNVILEESTKKFENIQWQKKEDKHVDGKWRFVVKVPNHNHPASPPEVHPMHQCMNETQFESVIALTQAGTRSRKVLSSLMQKDPDTVDSTKNIFNTKTKRRTEYLSGRSPIQAFSHFKNLTEK